MLKSTKEYAGFGAFVEDSGGNAMRLPENVHAEKEEDTQQWVPTDAFQMAY